MGKSFVGVIVLMFCLWVGFVFVDDVYDVCVNVIELIYEDVVK